MGLSISISSPQNAKALEDEQQRFVEEAQQRFLEIKRADIDDIMTKLDERVVGMEELKGAIRSVKIGQKKDSQLATLVIGHVGVGRHYTLQQFAEISGYEWTVKGALNLLDEVKAHHEKSMQINVY